MSGLKKLAKYVAYILIGMLGLAVAFVVVVNIAPDFVLSGISKSYIDANVPSNSDFDSFLQRDLNSYFSQKLGAAASVQFELLRSGPTQSGTAYPKYYVWVTVQSGTFELQGAARVAAVDKVTFSVTDFVSLQEIISQPNILQQIFPSEVIQKINRHFK